MLFELLSKPSRGNDGTGINVPTLALGILALDSS